MRRMQVIAVVLCVMLNALDGFDVLAISFASPGIAAEWGIDRAVLGVVLSMELIGMAVGSIVIGGLADRVGRRPVVFGSLVIMATSALERVNAVLRRLGHSVVAALPAPSEDAPRATIAQLFAPGLARTTALLTVAYFAHIMTFYFILKWIPKIVVDMGFAPSTAGGVLVWANVGGATGALMLSLLTQRFSVRALVIGALVLSAAMVTLFGQGQSDLQHLAMVAGVAGMCTNAAVVGLCTILAQSFPTAVRAGGTGFVIGVGRGGAALGPIIAGLLFSRGVGLPTVAVLMALGSILAAGALSLLQYREQPVAA